MGRTECGAPESVGAPGVKEKVSEQPAWALSREVKGEVLEELLTTSDIHTSASGRGRGQECWSLFYFYFLTGNVLCSHLHFRKTNLWQFQSQTRAGQTGDRERRWEGVVTWPRRRVRTWPGIENPWWPAGYQETEAEILDNLEVSVFNGFVNGDLVSWDFEVLE